MVSHIVIIFFLVANSAIIFSQKNWSTIYLKDGTVFVGEIVEQKEHGIYTVKSTNGVEMFFHDSEINGIENGYDPYGDINKYGGSKAFGVSLFGPGFFGIGYHHQLSKNIYFNMQVHLTFTYLKSNRTNSWEEKGGFATTAGLSYFPEKYFDKRKGIISSLGLFVNSSYIFGNFNALKLSGGFAKEFFRRGDMDNSFILEFGSALKFRYWVDEPFFMQYNEGKKLHVWRLHIRFSFNIYLRNNEAILNNPF